MPFASRIRGNSGNAPALSFCKHRITFSTYEIPFARWRWLAGFLLCLLYWQAEAAAPTITIGQNFTGSTFGVNSSATPADCNGVIGPRHFVEFINGSFAIYNKTNGQSVKRLWDWAKFWANAGIVLATSDIVTDPKVIL